MNNIVLSNPNNGVGRIGYKNLLETGTVTSSHNAVGFEMQNAYDNFGYDWWRAGNTTDWSWLSVENTSAVYADYMAIYGHNLADIAGEVKAQYSYDGTTWVDITGTQFFPTTNNVIYVGFEATLAAYFRINVRSSDASGYPLIAGAMIGESLELPRDMESGFSPPSIVPIITSKTAQSESGAFIGGSRQSEGIEGSIDMKLVSPLWVRSDWIPFITHVQTPKPFVFAWDAKHHDAEVVLAWSKWKVKAPSYSSVNFMNVSLDFEGKL